MSIEEKKLKHWIDNFYGYGSWRARFWFIGYEEGGGEVPEEVAEKFNYFSQAHAPPDASGQAGALCDIRELYQHVAVRWDGPKANLFANRYEYRFGSSAIQHGVWKNLIAFVHGYRNKELPDLLAYQKHNFALPSAQQEALISLYPLPSPHNHAWYYSWLDLPQIGFLKSRAQYEAHVYESRMRTILTNMRTNKPEVVLMYGMNSINALKKSVNEFFSDAKFTMVKAIKQQIPQHHRADLNGTILLITTQIPALRHNRIETGFDWEESEGLSSLSPAGGGRGWITPLFIFLYPLLKRSNHSLHILQNIIVGKSKHRESGTFQIPLLAFIFLYYFFILMRNAIHFNHQH